MKIPTNGSDNNSGRPVTMADVQAAEAQASRSQQEAVRLRERLEAMEDLLAATKSRISQTNRIMAAKDERLAEVNRRTKQLGENVHSLESRFDALKVLQGQLAEKKGTLISSLEASVAEAKAESELERAGQSSTDSGSSSTVDENVPQPIVDTVADVPQPVVDTTVAVTVVENQAEV